MVSLVSVHFTDLSRKRVQFKRLLCNDPHLGECLVVAKFCFVASMAEISL